MPGESHGRRSLVGYSHGVAKSRTRLSDFTSLHFIDTHGFPSGSMVKNPPASVGDARDEGSVPGSGRSPGEEITGNPLQYSCLGNPMDRGVWQVTVHGVPKDL